MAKTLLLLLALLLSATLPAQNINRYDVVISEFMPDPTPQVGLPNNEWVELKNTSAFAINLQGWRIGDASSLSGPMPAFILQPDSFVIVSTAGAVSNMSLFGRAISVSSFPSLDNDGDLIYIQNAQGRIMHALEYKVSWFQNPVKADGGWTLEMVDPKNPCAGQDNWRASMDPAGGTPGRKNSVDGVLADNTPPVLIRAYAIDSVTLVAVFSEPLDSASASSVARYAINNTLPVQSAAAQNPLLHTVVINLAAPMQKGILYTLTAVGISDCKGNQAGMQNVVRFGLPQEPSPGDLVINEILFNPKPNAFDFVEVYNKSNKILDAAKLMIANRNSAGAISSFRSFTSGHYLIFPGEHLVLTADAASLPHAYFVQDLSKVIAVTLPSYPNDKGTVVVTDHQGNVIDEVTYSEKWHFALISNRQGISLERIDPEGPSNEASNWTSAASTVGYATPTYKNSQYRQPVAGTAAITVSPKMFSPDHDGNDDMAIIQYQVQQTGFIANVLIYDAGGRLVRTLVRNGTLGYTGKWTWDGLDDKGQKLPVGTYVIFTEMFTLDGKRQQFRNAIVLARRLN